MARLFKLGSVPDLAPRYNVAPTQTIGAVVQQRETAAWQWQNLHWGLIPHWATDAAIGSRMINARSESAAQKPAFREAIKYRRCLIPADGFYEWEKGGRSKQPFYITLTDGALFAFAGLWEHWSGENGVAIESCTILTTEPNDLVRQIHNRMPVIVQPPDFPAWLNPQIQNAPEVMALLKPLDARRMTACPVSTYVNNPRNEGAECVRAAGSVSLFE